MRTTFIAAAILVASTFAMRPDLGSLNIDACVADGEWKNLEDLRQCETIVDSDDQTVELNFTETVALFAYYSYTLTSFGIGAVETKQAREATSFDTYYEDRLADSNGSGYMTYETWANASRDPESPFKGLSFTSLQAIYDAFGISSDWATTELESGATEQQILASAVAKFNPVARLAGNLEAKFNTVDRDSNQCISGTEWSDLPVFYAADASAKFVREAFTKFDANFDGCIVMDELITQSVLQFLAWKEFQQLFSLLDVNQNGWTDGEEAHRTLEDLYFTQVESDQFMELFDSNQDGQVNQLEMWLVKSANFDLVKTELAKKEDYMKDSANFWEQIDINGNMQLDDQELENAIPECSYDPNENTLAHFADFAWNVPLIDWAQFIYEGADWNNSGSVVYESLAKFETEYDQLQMFMMDRGEYDILSKDTWDAFKQKMSDTNNYLDIYQVDEDVLFNGDMQCHIPAGSTEVFTHIDKYWFCKVFMYYDSWACPLPDYYIDIYELNAIYTDEDESNNTGPDPEQEEEEDVEKEIDDAIKELQREIDPKQVIEFLEDNEGRIEDFLSEHADDIMMWFEDNSYRVKDLVMENDYLFWDFVAENRSDIDEFIMEKLPFFDTVEDFENAMEEAEEIAEDAIEQWENISSILKEIMEKADELESGVLTGEEVKDMALDFVKENQDMIVDFIKENQDMVMEFVSSKIHDMIDVDENKMKLEDLIEKNLDMIKEMILGMASDLVQETFDSTLSQLQDPDYLLKKVAEFGAEQLGTTVEEIEEMGSVDAATEFVASQLGMTVDEVMEKATMDTAMAYIMKGADALEAAGYALPPIDMAMDLAKMALVDMELVDMIATEFEVNGQEGRVSQDVFTAHCDTVTGWYGLESSTTTYADECTSSGYCYEDVQFQMFAGDDDSSMSFGEFQSFWFTVVARGLEEMTPSTA